MYKKRIKKVTENMREMGLSQIIVTSSAPVYYLTGQWVDPHERMLALYLDDTGRGVLFGNLLFKLNQQVFPQQIHTDNDESPSHRDAEDVLRLWQGEIPAISLFGSIQ